MSRRESARTGTGKEIPDTSSGQMARRFAEFLNQSPFCCNRRCEEADAFGNWYATQGKAQSAEEQPRAAVLHKEEQSREMSRRLRYRPVNRNILLDLLPGMRLRNPTRRETYKRPGCSPPELEGFDHVSEHNDAP